MCLWINIELSNKAHSNCNGKLIWKSIWLSDLAPLVQQHQHQPQHHANTSFFLTKYRNSIYPFIWSNEQSKLTVIVIVEIFIVRLTSMSIEHRLSYIIVCAVFYVRGIWRIFQQSISSNKHKKPSTNISDRIKTIKHCWSLWIWWAFYILFVSSYTCGICVKKEKSLTASNNNEEIKWNKTMVYFLMLFGWWRRHLKVKTHCQRN